MAISSASTNAPFPGNNNITDRISNFPNEILCHILSFLPNQDAIRTTILSRRWLNLWVFAAPLQFNDLHFFLNWKFADDNPHYFDRWGEEDAENCRYVLQYFTNFVNKVLALRQNDESVKEFSLVLDQPFDNSLITSWISWPLSRQIQNLEVSYYPCYNQPSRPIVLCPPCVFDCRMLSYLKLSGNFLIDPPQNSVINFPNLKSVYIMGVTFGDEAFASNFLSSPPLLEEIIIGGLIITRGCSSHGYRDLCISATRLKRLEVHPHSNVGYYNVRVRAPYLQYLGIKLDCAMHENIVFESSPDSIVELEISGIGSGAIKITELLPVLSQVKQLALLFYYINSQSPQSFDRSRLPMFYNLTTLKLRVDSHDNIFISQALNNAPILKDFVLMIDECVDDSHSTEQHCRLPNPVPRCVLTCLESIEIICGDQVKDLIGIFKDFLKYAKFLVEMKVTRVSIKSMGERKSGVLEDLLKLPRASSACEIELTDRSSHYCPYVYDEEPE